MRGADRLTTHRLTEVTLPNSDTIILSLRQQRKAMTSSPSCQIGKEKEHEVDVTVNEQKKMTNMAIFNPNFEFTIQGREQRAFNITVISGSGAGGREG